MNHHKLYFYLPKDLIEEINNPQLNEKKINLNKNIDYNKIYSYNYYLFIKLLDLVKATLF